MPILRSKSNITVAHSRSISANHFVARDLKSRKFKFFNTSARRTLNDTVDSSKTLETRKKKKKRKNRREMKGALARLQLGETLNQSSFSTSSSNPSRFQNLVEARAADGSLPSSAPLGTDVDTDVDDREFILSQDFFW